MAVGGTGAQSAVSRTGAQLAGRKYCCMSHVLYRAHSLKKLSSSLVYSRDEEPLIERECTPMRAPVFATPGLHTAGPYWLLLGMREALFQGVPSPSIPSRTFLQPPKAAYHSVPCALDRFAIPALLPTLPPWLAHNGWTVHNWSIDVQCAFTVSFCDCNSLPGHVVNQMKSWNTTPSSLTIWQMYFHFCCFHLDFREP